MEQEILKAVQYGGWSVVAIIFILRILWPLTTHWLSKKNGGNGSLWDKVEDLEHNHLHEINERLDRQSQAISELRKEVADVRDRVSRVEGRLLK